jgi:hypothetical protein
MSGLDDDFELWWEEEGNIFRNEEFKEQVKIIYAAGHKAGGQRPWYKITKEQFKVLMQTYKGTDVIDLTGENT